MNQGQQDMIDLLNKVEELDPELADHIYESDSFGACIKHPLVFSMMHFPQQNALVNNQLRHKKEALAKAEAKGDWHTYIFLHERPHRVDAFIEIMDRLSDSDYWGTLGGIWIDSENIRQNPRIWQMLLRSNRPEREAIMDEGERDDLAAMPESIVVYQGHTNRRHDGWSWTTSRETAEWFAHRFADFERARPVVTQGTVRRSNVIAYFTGRNESEIVADRRSVRNRTVTEISPREGTFNASRPVVTMTTSSNSTNTVANAFLMTNGTTL